MHKARLAHYITTGLFTCIMLMSSGMYVFNHDEVAKVFAALGYPVYIMYPLAAAKLLGLVAIWTRRSKTLEGMAYAGFFYDFVLAFFAHIMISDGDQWGAFIAMVLLGTSYATRHAR